MKLYSYFRSSAAYRVRIALNLKNIPYEMVPIHLAKDGGHNLKPEYQAINPQRKVPALQLSNGDILVQSMAIIAYLDEVYPEPALLPADAGAACVGSGLWALGLRGHWPWSRAPRA